MLVRLYDLPSAAPYYRRAAGAGVTVRRAEPWDRFHLRQLNDKHFPIWSAEADYAFSHQPITCFVAIEAGEVIGLAAYECTRRGFFGPTGVREDRRGIGLGAALLFRCLESMWQLGYAYAIIGSVGPKEFYEKVCGAFVIPGSDPGVYAEAISEMRARSQAFDESPP